MQHHQASSMERRQASSMELLNSLRPGLRQVQPENLPQRSTRSEERALPLLSAFKQFDLAEYPRRSIPLFRLGCANPMASATTHIHEDYYIEDNAYEPRPIHPDIHNTHFSSKNNTRMRLMQCDPYFNRFGLWGEISDLPTSNTSTSSSSTCAIIAIALETVKDSETTCWLDQGKPHLQQGQIDRQEALRRCSSSWSVPLHAARRSSSSSLSNFNHAMPCSGNCQEEIVHEFGTETIDASEVTTGCTNWRSINRDDHCETSLCLRDNIQRHASAPIVSTITRSEVLQRLVEKHGLHNPKGDALFGREPSGMVGPGVSRETDPPSCPKPVIDKSLLPHLRGYVSQLSRSWISEPSVSDALQGRDPAASLSVPQVRLSPLPISPAQEARMIAEVPVNNHSIGLIEQPRFSSPKKSTISNKTIFSKDKSSMIPFLNQKASPKNVNVKAPLNTDKQKAPSNTVQEEDDAHSARPILTKDTNKKHGALEKPTLHLISSNRKPKPGFSFPRQVSVGSESLVRPGGSSTRYSEKHWKIKYELLPHDQASCKHVQEGVAMEHLKKLMLKSAQTQLKLQAWDTVHGLPKSHSQTMVSTSRSRRQLREGIIIPKWDGTPLINDETELGKPKKRQRKEKHQGDEPSGKSCKSQSIGKIVKLISQKGLGPQV